MSKEFSEEFRDKLLDKGILIISGQESTAIPFCMCCDFEKMKNFVGKRPPQDLWKVGRYLLGFIPFCENCEDNCPPEGLKCLVNENTGRKISMDGVVKWIKSR